MAKYVRPDAITVRQLIEALSSFPPDAPVFVDDADTNWWMRCHGVEWLEDGDEKVIGIVYEEYSDIGADGGQR